MHHRGQARDPARVVPGHRGRRSSDPERACRPDDDRSRHRRPRHPGKSRDLRARFQDPHRVPHRRRREEGERGPSQGDLRRHPGDSDRRDPEETARIQWRGSHAAGHGGDPEEVTRSRRLRSEAGHPPPALLVVALLASVLAAACSGPGGGAGDVPGRSLEELSSGKRVTGDQAPPASGAVQVVLHGLREMVSYTVSPFLLRGALLAVQIASLAMVIGPVIGMKLDTFTTAVVGFGLNEAAFSAEIIRGGILSVNRTQALAAASFGMGPLLTLRRIILPQAMGAILPAIGNDTISMLKLTSL